MAWPMKICAVSFVGLLIWHCTQASVQPSVRPPKHTQLVRGIADVASDTVPEGANCGDASYQRFQAVALGAAFGLEAPMVSAPAFALNDAAGYCETDQSIVQYGISVTKAPDTGGCEETSSFLGKSGSFQSSVAPEAQLTMDELTEIDPSSAVRRIADVASDSVPERANCVDASAQAFQAVALSATLGLVVSLVSAPAFGRMMLMAIVRLTRASPNKAIDDMMAQLLKEKADGIKHEDFCTDEFNKNHLQT